MTLSDVADLHDALDLRDQLASLAAQETES